MNSKRHLPIAIRFSIITLTVIVICMPFRMPSLSQSYSNHYYENYIASGASEIPVQISYYSEVLQNDTAEIEINANVDIPAVDQIDVVIGTSFIPDQERALSAFFPYSDFFDSIELYQVYSSRMYDIKQTGFSCPQGSVYISESGEISLEYFEPIIHIESEEDIWELLDRAGYPVDQMILQRTEGGTYILFSAMDDIPVSSYPAFDKFTEYPTDGASMIIETNARAIPVRQGGVGNPLNLRLVQLHADPVRLLGYALPEHLHDFRIMIAGIDVAVQRHKTVRFVKGTHVSVAVAATGFLADHNLAVSDLHGVDDFVISRHALLRTVPVHFPFSSHFCRPFRRKYYT